MSKRRTKGEGSIFWSQNNNLWVSKITLPNGKEKRKRSKDKAVVQDWLLEQRKAISENRSLPDEKITFSKFADRYLEEVAKHTVRTITYNSYESTLRVHVKPEIGHIKLVSVRPHHLRSLYNKKLKSGLSNKTVHYIHSVTRRVLNEAVKWELIYRNPCDAVTPPKVEKKIPTVWTIEQAQKFLNSVKGHRWEGIYLIALSCGARRGEILGLEWNNINWDAGTITIEKAVSEIKGHAVITNPKTKSSRRTIKLPQVVLDLLKKNKKEEGLIFTSKTGTPIIPRNLLRQFHSVLNKLDIPRIPFHSLRHSCATILLQKETHPLLVKELLGHKTITTTLDIYSHVLPPMRSEVADKMDDIFK